MWAVRRLTADELRTKTKGAIFNMEQKWKDMTTAVINGESTTLWKVSVPMLTNPRDIEAGVELIWETLPTVKKQAAITNVTWVADQKIKEKTAKANAAKDNKRKAAEITSGAEI